MSTRFVTPLSCMLLCHLFCMLLCHSNKHYVFSTRKSFSPSRSVAGIALA